MTHMAFIARIASVAAILVPAHSLAAASVRHQPTVAAHQRTVISARRRQVRQTPRIAPKVYPARTDLRDLSGTYTGCCRTAGVDQFGKWRHRKVKVALDYLPNQAWSQWGNLDWMMAGWQGFKRAGGTLVLSIGLLPTPPSLSGFAPTPGVSLPYTFEAGAKGAYDRYWREFGEQLVSYDHGEFRNTILRLAWEANGNWYPWSLGASYDAKGNYYYDTTSVVAHHNSPYWFIRYWRRVVKILRSIKGQQFTYDYTTASGVDANGFNSSEAFPGDRYVNYLSIDIYDQAWGHHGFIKNPRRRWQRQTTEPFGLNYWTRFAYHHHLQVGVPEWGLTTASGDDPYFIKQMHRYFNRHNVAYEMYFNYGDGAIDPHSLAPSEQHYAMIYPRAAAEYRKLF